MKEIVIEAEHKQKALDKAKIFITIAVYLITAGTLLEFVSISLMLKIVGFMLAGQAFYFLWKSQKLSMY